MKSYKDAGVDLEKNKALKDEIKKSVRTTFNKNVIGDIGSFGGLFSASDIKSMKNPVLVASTDGVGTKLKIAKQVDKWDSVGIDLVNHSINDILVQGARPLFFMDYIAAQRLEPKVTSEIIKGLSKACIDANMVLLGGETAEMPGVYVEGEYDLAGTIVGVVEKSEIIDGSTVKEGDVMVGLASTGLHTNGYSLARNVLDTKKHAKALLEPHKSYLREISTLQEKVKIKALSHITGGGWIENIPRTLPLGFGVRIKKDSWKIPEIFKVIQKTGGISDDEMFMTFNMGIGMTIVLSKEDARKSGLPVIGEIIKGKGVIFA